jgi:tRNA(Ile)-lysidine synthase
MTRPTSIQEVTLQALIQRPILTEGCLVAVSGGPDSIALLQAVVECYREYNSMAPLIVGHVNHRLRGAESDADEQFVRHRFAKLAAQPGCESLRLSCTSIDTGAEAISLRQNLEALARKLRYDWLAEQARQHSVRWVLTAHTLNDQAETTLFHILRGTGIHGLRGMRRTRRLAEDVWLVRPWLKLHKVEILSYLKERGLDFRVDSSNQDLRFTRNRLRLDLLPKLQAEYNARILDALAALASRANHACRLLDRRMRTALEKIERPRVQDLLVFDLWRLQSLSAEELQALYAYVWRREGWPRGNMGLGEWERLAAWTQTSNKAMDLPEGIRAVKKRSVVQLGPQN